MNSTLGLVTVVADNYFDVLGVRPILGRLPDKNHDYSADSEPPIVLAHWFWQERMGAPADIIGRTMELSGRLYRVAAVLPPQFRGLEPMGSRHIWIPVGSWTRYSKYDLNRGSGQFQVLARLRPGASVEQAQAQLDVIAKRIESADSRVAKGRRLVGKKLRARDRTYEVVGVAVDGRIRSLYESPDPVLFLPASSMQWGETILIASTRADPAIVLKGLAKAAGQSGDLRVYQSMTLRTVLRQALYSDWIPTVLGGALAVVGLLLAAGGLYGAASYAAQRRVPEFAVRLAVGARPRQIAELVIRQGAWTCLAGVPVGAGLFLQSTATTAQRCCETAPSIPSLS